jgi:hypothetical protein
MPLRSFHRRGRECSEYLTSEFAASEPAQAWVHLRREYSATYFRKELQASPAKWPGSNQAAESNAFAVYEAGVSALSILNGV